MSEKELNKKIDQYLDERLIYCIVLSQLSDDECKEIVSFQEGYISELLEGIYNFQLKNKNALPKETDDNILNFIGKSGLRFSNHGVNKKYNDIINKIIENANNNKFVDSNFLTSEFRKFFVIGNKKAIKDCNLEDLYNLEQLVYDILVDFIYFSDDEFYQKYLVGGDGVGNESTLYVLNYLANDFPLIFKNNDFFERTDEILYYNREMCRKKKFSVEDIDDTSIKGKMLSYKCIKNFNSKNTMIMNNVAKKYI